MKKIGIYYKKRNKVIIDKVDYTKVFTTDELKEMRNACKHNTVKILCCFGQDQYGVYLEAFGVYEE